MHINSMSLGVLKLSRIGTGTMAFTFLQISSLVDSVSLHIRFRVYDLLVCTMAQELGP